MTVVIQKRMRDEGEECKSGMDCLTTLNNPAESIW